MRRVNRVISQDVELTLEFIVGDASRLANKHLLNLRFGLEGGLANNTVVLGNVAIAN